MKNFIHKFLNNHGYYNISELVVGGVCGCCGKYIPDFIYHDTYWHSHYGVCPKCKSEGDAILQIYGTSRSTAKFLTRKNMEEYIRKMGETTFRDELEEFHG